MTTKMVEKFIIRGDNDTIDYYYKTDKGNYYRYTSYYDSKGIRHFTSKTKINADCYELFKLRGETVEV